MDTGKTGSNNFREGKGCGDKGQQLEAFVYFDKEVSVSTVTIRSVVDINSFLMPPQEIEIWGGNNKASLHLLKSLRPEQPSKVAPIYLTGYDVSFHRAEIKIIKVILKPVSKLPVWHKGKGDKGWIFTDEIFLN